VRNESLAGLDHRARIETYGLLRSHGSREAIRMGGVGVGAGLVGGSPRSEKAWRVRLWGVFAGFGQCLWKKANGQVERVGSKVLTRAC
jgi:hypothetical protein